MQIPALLYGTNAEVRKRCRKALVRVVREQQPLVDAFEAAGMINRAQHPGLIVVEGPSPFLSKYVHFHCYVPFRLLMEQTLGPIDPAAQEAIFNATMERPWGMLCLLSPNNMVSWFYGAEPDRYRRYLRATLRYWDELDAEGACYSEGSTGGERLWKVASPVRQVLHRLGVPHDLLRHDVPLPPGGLGALLAQADRSLAGDLVYLGAAAAANRHRASSDQHHARAPYTDVASDPSSATYMSEQMAAAIQANDVKAVQRLVSAGEPANALTSEGVDSLLFWAVRHGHTDLVRFLLDHGADIEDRGLEGESPLMIAAMHGHRDTVQLLLDRGAHPNYVTDKGWDVVSFAEMGGDAEVIAMLERVCQARVRRPERRN